MELTEDGKDRAGFGVECGFQGFVALGEDDGVRSGVLNGGDAAKGGGFRCIGHACVDGVLGNGVEEFGEFGEGHQ